MISAICQYSRYECPRYKSGIVVAKQAFEKYSSIKKFCADSGYIGTFVELWIKIIDKENEMGKI